MLTLASLRSTRLDRHTSQKALSSLSRIPHDRLKTLENQSAEPWFDEALTLSQVLQTGGIWPLILSCNMTQSTAPIGNPSDHELELWRSGRRTPLSMAVRISRVFGLSDPSELAATPLQRQLWDVLSTSERNPEGCGWCPWCAADIVGGSEHLPTCVPNNLWAAPDTLIAVTPLRPMVRGKRETGTKAYGLAALRERAGLRQTDLAKVLEVHANHYARVERGDLVLSPALARKLATYYGVDQAVLYPPPGLT